MKFLEDEDIRLRAVEPGDSALMWEIENDSTQWRDNGMSAPYSRHNLEEYALNYDADPIRAGQIRLVCELKNGEVVGLLDLYDISAVNRTAFVGIYIVKPHRGRGYASKCLNLSEQYATRLLNLRILAAKVGEDNETSIRLFTGSGFERAGELKDWLLCGSETRSLLVFTKQINKLSNN